ncbi:MAG: hypothetical protein EOO27_39615, partial [Comamonadaceae bacterium]
MRLPAVPYPGLASDRPATRMGAGEYAYPHKARTRKSFVSIWRTFTVRQKNPSTTMYQYTDFDRHFVHQRAAQFRDQLERWQSGRLTEDEFKPLRL